MLEVRINLLEKCSEDVLRFELGRQVHKTITFKYVTINDKEGRILIREAPASFKQSNTHIHIKPQG